MRRPIAAIDIGTFTARLLIAYKPDRLGALKTVSRMRSYIRLGESFDHQKRIISSDAVERTIEVLKGFLHQTRSFEVKEIHAIATGVVREAVNQAEFLDRIRAQTGLSVHPVTSEDEALLTSRGVLSGFGKPAWPILGFDLGGGSTEFFYRDQNREIVRSIPLGAVLLSREYLRSDPPEPSQLDLLEQAIDRQLNELDLTFEQNGKEILMAGTGGTVTTLALMHKKEPPNDASVKQLHGLDLTRGQIEALFKQVSTLKLIDRQRLPGLDPERAKIIIAGCLAVLRVLDFMKSHSLRVSISDLLEGILLNSCKGENDE